MFRLIVALSVVCLVAADNDGNRVVMGRGASCTEFPYQVSLEQDGRHFCGGSILNNNWILSAAHCFVDVILHRQVDSITARMGTSNRESGGVVKRIEALINHPLYNRQTFYNDVGLAKVMGMMTYSAVIKPIKMCANVYASGHPVILTGWGKVHDRNPNPPIQMQMAEMKVLTTEDCGSPRYAYGRSAIMPEMICATGEATGAGSCQGDSGGPLVLRETLCQLGIVSFGMKCADPAYPGVYTKIVKVLPFITQYTGPLSLA